MKMKPIFLLLAASVYCLTGCKTEREVYLALDDYIKVTNQGEGVNENYEIITAEVYFDSAEPEVGNFYQEADSRAYYLWHKDMDQATLTHKAEIGYYDLESKERVSLLHYDQWDDFWLNEMLAWEDCIVWLE